MVTAIGDDVSKRITFYITLSKDDYDFLQSYIIRNRITGGNDKLLSVRVGCETLVKNFILQEKGFVVPDYSFKLVDVDLDDKQ